MASPQSQTDVVAHDFPQFPNLQVSSIVDFVVVLIFNRAKEIRCLIWDAALAEPQIIPIKSRTLQSKYAIPLANHAPLTRINVEARKQALKVQTPLFKARKGVPKIYVNLAIDILWVPSLDKEILKFRGLSDEKRKQIQKLAIFADFGSIGRSYDLRSPEFVYTHLVRLSGLKEIYLVSGSNNEIATEKVFFVNPTKLPPVPAEYSSHHISPLGCMIPSLGDLLMIIFNRLRKANDSERFRDDIGHRVLHTKWLNGAYRLDDHTVSAEESQDGYNCYKDSEGLQHCDSPPDTYVYPLVKYTEVIKAQDVSGMLPAPEIVGHVPKFEADDWKPSM